MCPGRLSGGGKSQNGAKSRRFGMDLPSRAFYEVVNPKTIWNNCVILKKVYQTSQRISKSSHICLTIVPESLHLCRLTHETLSFNKKNSARFYSASLHRWLVPDPQSEKYYGVSPYAYCAGNPRFREHPRRHGKGPESRMEQSAKQKRKEYAKMNGLVQIMETIRG